MGAPTTATAGHRIEDEHYSVIDDAVTVWVMLEAALELPATPETKQHMTQARKRLDSLIEAAGLSEEILREHLVRRREIRQAGLSTPTSSVVVPLWPVDALDHNAQPDR